MVSPKKQSDQWLRADGRQKAHPSSVWDRFVVCSCVAGLAVWDYMRPPMSSRALLAAAWGTPHTYARVPSDALSLHIRFCASWKRSKWCRSRVEGHKASRPPSPVCPDRRRRSLSTVSARRPFTVTQYNRRMTGRGKASAGTREDWI